MKNKVMTSVRKPTCVGCPDSFRYEGSIPMKQHGVMMHLGERYCIGGRKARRFRRGDPTVYVPAWCPKRKSPCELRIYGFKSQDDWMLHTMLCQELGHAISPSANRYAVDFELRTELTPPEFWRRCDTEPIGELLHVAVHRYQVVEIDDGLKPCFFYKTDEGFEYCPQFDAQTARKNTKEDTD